MKTIKISHYINDKLKPLIDGKDKKYPVYVRVLLGREVMRFKSGIGSDGKNTEYHSKASFSNDEILPLKIANEEKLISYAVNNLLDWDQPRYLPAIVRVLQNNVIDELSIILNITQFPIARSFESKYNPNFFEALDNTLAAFLYVKTGIRKDFFTDKQLLSDIRLYPALPDGFKSSIPYEDIKQLFLLATEFSLFEVEQYSDVRPLNTFEWRYNNGQSDFIKRLPIALLSSSAVTTCIESLNVQLEKEPLIIDQH